MCEIVAAASPAANIVPVLLDGLRTLEYRGYDSARLVVLNGAGTERVRTTGRVAELAAAALGVAAQVGIAHTRWATRCTPSNRNAHPHASSGITVMQNCIIEKQEALRSALSAQGCVFTSDTATIAGLVEAELRTKPDLLKAVDAATPRLVGADAIAVIDQRQREPGEVVATRKGSLLPLGQTSAHDDSAPVQGYFTASDAPTLLQITSNMIYLENGEIADLTAAGIRIAHASSMSFKHPVVVSQLSADAVELGHYQHYMQKEFFEQPDTLTNTLKHIGNSSLLPPDMFGADSAELPADMRAVLILVCGTSNHSGLTAPYWHEALISIPCTVENATEYRYHSSIADPDQLVVAIAESSETADTLAALSHKALGHARTLNICSVPASAIMRECALRFITRTYPEIGIASAKSFNTQLAGLFLLTLVVAAARVLQQAFSSGRSTGPRKVTYTHMLRRALRQTRLARTAIQQIPQSSQKPAAADASAYLRSFIFNPAHGAVTQNRKHTYLKSANLHKREPI